MVGRRQTFMFYTRVRGAFIPRGETPPKAFLHTPRDEARRDPIRHCMHHEPGGVDEHSTLGMQHCPPCFIIMALPRRTSGYWGNDVDGDEAVA